jgi:hypothetical protein
VKNRERVYVAYWRKKRAKRGEPWIMHDSMAIASERNAHLNYLRQTQDWIDWKMVAFERLSR